MNKVGKTWYFKDGNNPQINLVNVILIQISADILYWNWEACYKTIRKFKGPNNQKNRKKIRINALLGFKT